jgi:hypothetical protein
MAVMMSMMMMMMTKLMMGDNVDYGDDEMMIIMMMMTKMIACTVRKMGLLLRCIQRRLQMQLSMARKFTLQPYRR